MASNNFSQCPGESYDEFYQISDGTLSVNFEKLYETWMEKQPEFYEVKCRLKEGDKVLTHRFETMEEALKMSSMMLKNGCWIIESIITKR